MESVEVALDGGKSCSHFLSAGVGVDGPRMRSARRGEQHAISSCHSDSQAANFVNTSLNIVSEETPSFCSFSYIRLHLSVCILF